MTRSPPVRMLLDAWREVGRHLDIGESVVALTPRLKEVLPVARVVVRGLDPAARRVETAAAVPAVPGDAGPRGPSRREVDEPAWASLLAWCREGRVRVVRSGARDPLRAPLVPAGIAGPVALGPLVREEQPIGVLVLELRSEPAAHDLELVADLLEPLAAALANDRRLHELARLREAMEADNRALLTRLERQDISDTIVGSSSGMRVVMQRVEQVAPTDAPVMILGETGTGKEVVARAIHTGSRRRGGPFLRVNCGAIPSELVDSELFGHERGSFTGAIATRKGWFERADGGTLFLDELGELPPAAQVRLLRVLQDGSFERVGGQSTLSADVRIVAATHRDIRRRVADGLFREDLWYRISVFPIPLPPLRERRQDIGALAAHFAARAGLRLHGVALAPSSDDVRALVTYDWPGNVRELAAVIERAAILGGGRRLDVATALGAHPSPAAVEPLPPGSLEAANRQAITEALLRSRGRIEGSRGAARLLGVNASTLRSRMAKLGIPWQDFRSIE